MAENTTPNLRSWDAWHQVHQPFELGWWRDALARGHSQNDVEFRRQWRPIREFIELPAEGIIIDIGSGPRPPFAPCVVIDPLAAKYQTIAKPEWWQGVRVYAQRAEDVVRELVGEARTVVCWNCLDHTIGWRAILDNIKGYLAPGGKAAISTDFHEPFAGHPGYPMGDFMREVTRRFDIVKIAAPFDRALALVLTVPS